MTRISEVYKYSSPDQVKEKLRGYKVIGWRAPKYGETYLTVGGGVTNNFDYYMPDPQFAPSERFILERLDA